jgi:hypothetical protein
MKKYFLTGFALFFLSGFVFSQIDIPLKYAGEITEQGLKKQLTIVASTEMEGRETGTNGQRKAASYIESQFKEIGLQYPESLKGYQQYYPLFKDTLISRLMKIDGRVLTYGKDYILQPGYTTLHKKLKATSIVFAGYGIEDSNYNDYEGKEVKDKIVLIFSGEPQVNEKSLVTGTNRQSKWAYSINAKAALAKEKGAVAVLFVNPLWDSIPSILIENSKKTNLYFPHLNDKPKAAVISIAPSLIKNITGAGEANTLIEAAKAKKPLNNFNIDRKLKTKLVLRKKRIKVEASNVIGYVEGSDKKDEYVFITAHYDHLGKQDNVIYYGADDDGSGTVSVIEMAQAFSKAKQDGHGPRRTMVFMTVSGEEKGLWGSEYYSDHPVFPLDNTTIDLNIDMVGRIDPNRNYGDSTNYVYVIGNDKLSSDLDPISKAINKKYSNLELDYKYNAPDDPDRIYYRSDHYNFARKGVPIIFVFDGIHKDYHKPTDTVDKINFDLLEKRARFIFLIAWEMANRDEMLKRDIPLPTEVR